MLYVRFMSATGCLVWASFDNFCSRAIFQFMGEKLHDLLNQDNPIALPRIEKALLAQDDLSTDQEAVLGALSEEVSL